MRAWIGSFLSLAGLSCALTLLFLGMRSVMEIGGACASGGAYEVAVECPEGVPVLMLAGIWGGIVCAGLTAWYVAKLGGHYVGLVAWAWVALFLSLGWNFLEYGLDPPGEDTEVAIGWLVCAAIFGLMGGLPALALLRPSVLRSTFWGDGEEEAPAAARPTARDFVPLGQTLSLVRARAATAGGGGAVVASTPRGGDVASQLERLARLHHRGDLDDAEYDAAKRAVLGE